MCYVKSFLVVTAAFIGIACFGYGEFWALDHFSVLQIVVCAVSVIFIYLVYVCGHHCQRMKELRVKGEKNV